MNNVEKVKKLEQALSVTLEMKNKIQAEAWDEIIVLEQQRQTLLDTVFPIESFDAQLRAIIEQILQLNNHIESQCSKVKAELQQQLTGMNKNKKAMNAYLQP